VWEGGSKLGMGGEVLLARHESCFRRWQEEEVKVQGSREQGWDEKWRYGFGKD